MSSWGNELALKHLIKRICSRESPPSVQAETCELSLCMLCFLICGERIQQQSALIISLTPFFSCWSGTMLVSVSRGGGLHSFRIHQRNLHKKGTAGYLIAFWIVIHKIAWKQKEPSGLTLWWKIMKVLKDICQMLEYISGEECTSRGGEEQAQDLFHCYSAQLREFRVDRHTRHPSVVNDISLSHSSLRYKYKWG